MTSHRVLSDHVLSKGRKIALVCCKSVSASLSMIASSIIIYKLYLKYKSQSSSIVSKRSSKNDGITTYHRMLLGISMLDVIHSVVSALGPFLVPSSTNALFAHGTNASCKVMGALQQLTPTVVIYMATLNTYFMLKIRYNVSDLVIKTHYEVWFHMIPILFFLATAVIGLSLGIFGPIVVPELGCWIDSFCVYTKTCKHSSPLLNNHLDYYSWSFAFMWLFVCVIVVAVNSILIYTAIRTQEQRNAKYLGARLQKEDRSSMATPTRSSKSMYMASVVQTTAIECDNDHLKINDSDFKLAIEEDFEDENFESLKHSLGENEDTKDHSSSTNNSATNVSSSLQLKKRLKHSRVAAIQSMLYIGSALFTAIWSFLPWLGSRFQLNPTCEYFFAFMSGIVYPLQGVFNLFVYVRLQYLELRESRKDWSRFKCVKQCLISLG
jgi:hypothetical protein